MKQSDETDPLAPLREQLAGLQREVSSLEEDLETLTRQAAEAEAAAMRAVENGDDAAARKELVRQAHAMEAAELVGTELRSLEALLRSCREMLAAVDG